MSEIDKIGKAVEKVIQEKDSMPEIWVDAHLESISEGVDFLASRMSELDYSILRDVVATLNALSQTFLALAQLNSPHVRRGVLGRIGNKVSRLLLQAVAMQSLMELDQLKLSLSELRNSRNSEVSQRSEPEDQPTLTSA